MKVQDAVVRAEALLEGCGDELTMYRLAAVLSDALGRRVREQQMYNYRKNRLVRVNADGRITHEDAVAFVAKQIAKHNS